MEDGLRERVFSWHPAQNEGTEDCANAARMRLRIKSAMTNYNGQGSLSLLGKVRMGFKQSKPHPIPLLYKERGNNSPKFTSRFTVHPSPKKRTAFTLAEGATRVALPNSQRRAAFTLAEVLITLGIIGVVAAMTLPSVITKYEKHEAVNRLKKSYSTINQALVFSQAENGDFSEWGIERQEADWDNYQDKLSKLVKQNIIPYLKVLKDCEYDKCKDAADTTFRDGTVSRWYGNRTHYVIYLNDGSRILFFINNSNDDDGINRWHELVMLLDINGDSKPNRMGRDVFSLYLYADNRKVNMYGTSFSREAMLSNCENYGSYCGGLIQTDGWQIKDDYPW